MARIPNSATDFVVPVDGIGTFTFAKKTMRDQIAIEVEYSRLTEGIETVTNFLWNLASSVSVLKVLTVTAPDGWNLDALDPEEPESYDKLMKVWSALRDKQASFRKGNQGDGAAPGAEAG